MDLIVESEESALSQKTTKFIKSCIEQYPTFKKNIVILKTLLGQRNLHKSYTGGLSSYPLSLFYISILKIKRLQNSEDLIETLLEFQKFVFHDFDPSKQMICFGNSEQILQPKSSTHFMSGLVLINTSIDNSNLTNNSLLFS